MNKKNLVYLPLRQLKDIILLLLFCLYRKLNNRHPEKL